MTARASWAVAWVAVVAGLCSACGGSSSAAAPAAITLGGAATQSSYTPEEAIEVVLTLTNTGGTATNVSVQVPGAIELVSVKRNGLDVAPTDHRLYGVEETQATLDGALEPLAPGAAVEVEVDTAYTPEHDGWTLQEIDADMAGDPRSREYDLSVPGTYVLRFAYEYAGPIPAGLSVFAGRSNEHEVTFTVTP